MKISINAPSYKRPDGLDVLDYIPQTRIWICETELKEYRTLNKGKKIITCPKGIQGNVSRIRNHILDQEFSRGMDAVCLVDDDLKYIGYYEYNKREKLNLFFPNSSSLSFELRFIQSTPILTLGRAGIDTARYEL